MQDGRQCRNRIEIFMYGHEAPFHTLSPGAHALQRVSMVSYSKLWNDDSGVVADVEMAGMTFRILVDGNGGWCLRCSGECFHV